MFYSWSPPKCEVKNRIRSRNADVELQRYKQIDSPPSIYTTIQGLPTYGPLDSSTGDKLIMAEQQRGACALPPGSKKERLIPKRLKGDEERQTICYFWKPEDEKFEKQKLYPTESVY